MTSLIREAQEARRRAAADAQETRLARWIIVKSEYKHELAVSRQIEAMGYPAWVPMEVRFHRITTPSKVKRAHTWEAPVIPTVLFAAVPVAVQGQLVSLRGCHSLHRPDAVSAPFLIAPEQIEAFRDMVALENARLRRQFQRRQEGKRAKKTVVKLGDENAFKTLMAELFGLEVAQMEEAA